ncbi:hypothetical protein PG994_000182 [Apiospora phragmitis]|uniref:DUF7580 domain-containing protein n=1 Tax=Apiospora phragmitis TaxID=2905665 RepID=A0ABR1X5Q9_9PEZI
MTESLWKDKSKLLVKSALKSAMRKTPRPVTALTASSSTGNATSPPQVVTSMPPRQVRFLNQPKPPDAAVPVQTDPLVIDKLCYLMTAPLTDGGLLEILETEEPAHIVLKIESSSQIGTGPSSIMSLNQFSSSAVVLKERMVTALGILRTFLSLGVTQWVPGGLGKDDIQVMRNPGGSVVSRTQSFIHHESLSGTLKSAVASKRQRTEATLFAFGVILLELLYQQSLEQQPFRNEYLSNGQPNDYSDLCTAKRWQETVYEDFDEPISEAIRRCIDCAFTPRADFGDKKFLQEVLDGVLVPLEDFVTQLA